MSFPPDLDRLLQPAPLPLEMGHARLPNGVLHVACRTDMPRCRGEMLEWWFRFRPTTQHYTWWHPADHVSSAWLEGREGTHIGSIHQVEERFGAGPVKQLLIQLREPGEFFSDAALQAARAAGHVSGLVCGRGGESWQAPRDPQGRVLGTRLFHIARDTDWGCVLRSHFFLGWDLPAAGRSPAEMATLLPDPVAPALLTHCYSEFSYLARFLPSLFMAENRAERPVPLPW
jgi:hypothetical protein